LPPERAAEVVKRLKLPSRLSDDILSACELWDDIETLVDLPPSDIVDRLEALSSRALYSLYISTDHESIREILYKYVSEWQHVSPSITGHDLRAKGLPPGPAYKHILKTLRDAWLDSKIKTRREEGRLVKELIAEDMEAYKSE